MFLIHLTDQQSSVVEDKRVHDVVLNKHVWHKRMDAKNIQFNTDSNGGDAAALKINDSWSFWLIHSKINDNTKG